MASASAADLAHLTAALLIDVVPGVAVDMPNPHARDELDLGDTS